MDIEKIMKTLDEADEKSYFRKSAITLDEKHKPCCSTSKKFKGGIGSMFDFDDIADNVADRLDDNTKTALNYGVQAMITTGLIIGGATLLSAGVASIKSLFDRPKSRTIIELENEDENDPENGEVEDEQ